MNLLLKLNPTGANPFGAMNVKAALFVIGKEEITEYALMRAYVRARDWSEIRAALYPAKVIPAGDAEDPDQGDGAFHMELQVPEATVNKSSLMVAAFFEDEPVETVPIPVETLRKAFDDGCHTLVVGWSSPEQVLDALICAGMQAEAAMPGAHRVLALDASAEPIAVEDEAAPARERVTG